MQDDVLAKEACDKTSKADIDTDAQTVTRLIADEMDTAASRGKRYPQRSRFIEHYASMPAGGGARWPREYAPSLSAMGYPAPCGMGAGERP